MEATQWENIFAICKINKTPEYIKNTYTSRRKKQLTQFFKWPKDFQRHFTREYTGTIHICKNT